MSSFQLSCHQGLDLSENGFPQRRMSEVVDEGHRRNDGDRKDEVVEVNEQIKGMMIHLRRVHVIYQC